MDATAKKNEQPYQLLERYCQNITQQAQDGKLDPLSVDTKR